MRDVWTSFPRLLPLATSLSHLNTEIWAVCVSTAAKHSYAFIVVCYLVPLYTFMAILYNMIFKEASTYLKNRRDVVLI